MYLYFDTIPNFSFHLPQQLPWTFLKTDLMQIGDQGYILLPYGSGFVNGLDSCQFIWEK